MKTLLLLVLIGGIVLAAHAGPGFARHAHLRASAAPARW
jgi:hypothetical protein